MIDKLIKLFFTEKNRKCITYKRKENNFEGNANFEIIKKYSNEKDFLVHEQKCRLILTGSNG